MTTIASAGLHHVTAIAGPARRNLDFYTRTLGLRLVKKTVNFDDPGAYHFYFGDGAGTPGTILTFFPWERAAPGRAGAGETAQTAFRIPRDAIGFWTHRLIAAGVSAEGPSRAFGDSVLRFRDPDGTRLALVGVEPGAGDPLWSGGGVEPDVAIRGFHGVTLALRDLQPTAEVLTQALGLAPAGAEEGALRFSGAAPFGAFVTLRKAPEAAPARLGAGSVHHVAFRAADDAAQAAMARALEQNFGLRPTPQIDRSYFRSVYVREPGGVLFEIATEAPGFAIDEAPEALGSSLMLPPQHEPRRAAIAAALPDLG